MNKPIHNVRRWLNPKDHSDSGMLHVMVDVDDDPEYPYVGVDFTIWDCSRKVTLDFSFCTMKEAKQRAEKIDLLIQELTNLKAVMGVAYNHSFQAMENREEPEDE